MAGNQSRVVELQIKLAGVQSLQELEDTTAEINKELKGLAVNSKEFNKMGALAQKAASQVKEVGEKLAGITSTEKAEAVNKLGQGLVGAFQAGAGASLLFGEKTSEAMQKSIAKVASLFAITDGLKKLTEAFSAKNVAALKAVVKGWQESAIAAKLFGTATRAAITATGIGILVVLLGTVVANWDKVKKAMISAFDTAKKFVPLFQTISDAIDYMSEKFGSFNGFIQSAIAYVKELLTTFDFGKANEALNKTAATQKELNKLQAQYDILITIGKDSLDAQLSIMEAQGKTQQEMLEVQKKYNDGLIKNLEARKKLGEDVNVELNALKQENTVIGIKIENEKKLAKEKAKTAQATANATARQKAIDEANRISQIKELEYLKQISQQQVYISENLYRISGEYDTLLNKYEEALNANIRNADEFNIQLDLLSEMSNAYDTILAAREKLINFDKEGQKIFDYQYASQTKSLEAIQEEVDAAKKLIEAGIVFNNLDEDSVRIKEDILNMYATEYAIFEKTENLKQQAFEREIQDANDRKKLAEDENKLAEERIKYLNDAYALIDKQLWAQAEIYNSAYAANELAIKNNKNVLEAAQLLDKEDKKVQELRAARWQADADRKANAADILKATNDIADAENSIDVATNNIAISTAKVKAKQEEVTAEVEAQSRAYAVLQGFLAKYADEIQAAMDLLNNSLNLAADIAARRSEMAQRDLDEYKAINDAKLAADIKLYEDSAKARGDINSEILELMLTAEGDRYDDLKAQLDQNTADEAAALAAKLAAEAEYNKQVALMQYEIDVAKWQSEKREKAAALIMAGIQTALAVVKALPNIPLSIVVGAAGLAAMTSIAVAPISPKPEAPKLEKGGMLMGASHAAGGIDIEAEGGEYIVNKRSTAQWLPLLEAINMPKFANGGQVSVPNVVNNIPQMDYARIGNEVAAALRLNPMYVSVVEFRNVENRLSVVENRASIGKR